MPKTLLQIVQQFTVRTGLGKPVAVASSQDDGLLQMVGLLNEILDDLVDRRAWSFLQTEVLFTSVAGMDQGAVETLAPGYKKILNSTLFDRTRRLPIWGPRTPEQWQAIKALPMSSPFYQYRFRGGRLLITPDMPAGHQIAFEYETRYSVTDHSGTTPTIKLHFDKDSDTCAFGDAVLTAGLRWIWRREKGLAYDEDFRKYESQLANAQGDDGTRGIIRMDETCNEIKPGIFIPAGNWMTP